MVERDRELHEVGTGCIPWHYNRISLTKPQLQVGIARLREGDAVVCFSRKQVYALKQHIEENTKHKCSVVYGQLPPESR